MSTADCMTFGEPLFRLIFATLLGGLIGAERERHGRAAGLRTHSLLALGSALITIVSIKVSCAVPGIATDPGRIAAQIVTGIGFLGAGVIMHHGATVTGLTTATSIWVTAGLGLAVGMGFYAEGCFAATTVLVVLLILRPLEDKLLRKEFDGLLFVDSFNKGAPRKELDDILHKFGIRIRSHKLRYSRPVGKPELYEYELAVRFRDDVDLDQVTMALIEAFEDDDIKSVRWE
ncbi:MAG TPA: MgtC/SapB family protein [Candidatus Brocadiia bacterium]|nr:MgtC/SapB family protein [Candidatus Brocadiia bacterium]